MNSPPRWRRIRSGSVILTALDSGAGADLFSSSRLLAVLRRITIPRSAASGLDALAKGLCAALVVACVLGAKLVLPGYPNLFLRPEDPLVLILMLYAAIRRRLMVTPIDLCILSFVVLCTLSALHGLCVGTLHEPLLSLLCLLKLIEYFFVFYATLNLLDTPMEVRACWRVFMGACGAAALYGLLESAWPYAHAIHSAKFIYRTYERGHFHGDANHVAACLMFAAALVLGRALWAASWRCRVPAFGLYFLLLAAIATTYSRSAYVAIAASAFLLMSLRGGTRGALFCLAVLCLLIAFAPHDIFRRMSSIFIDLAEGGGGVAYRVRQIHRAAATIPEFPLLGLGLGARELVFYENVYMFLVSETGLLGAASFLLLLAGLSGMAGGVYRGASDAWTRGFAAGYLGGLAGLLIEGQTLPVFMLTRVAPPFWFASALLVWLWRRRAPAPAATAASSFSAPHGQRRQLNGVAP